MVKLLIEIVLAVVLLLFVATQIIIPLISDKWAFFWIFGKKKEVLEERPSTLGELEKETKVAVKQINKTKKKIEVVDKQLQEIKSQIN